MIILYAVPISLWAKKTGIFILGSLTIMTVDKKANKLCIFRYEIYVYNLDKVVVEMTFSLNI